MALTITSLTGNGLRDWALQRLSAWVIAGYVFFLLGFMMYKTPMTFEVWQQLFHCDVVRVASIFCLFSLTIHAWIGVWTVTTDYLKHTALRILVQGGFCGMLFLCLAGGLDIFWGM
jgi:succinate dehydrogenase / fumarate reductase membrane anchor subunit